jgi:hypothetical protein
MSLISLVSPIPPQDLPDLVLSITQTKLTHASRLNPLGTIAGFPFATPDRSWTISDVIRLEPRDPPPLPLIRTFRARLQCLQCLIITRVIEGNMKEGPFETTKSCFSHLSGIQPKDRTERTHEHPQPISLDGGSDRAFWSAHYI